LLYCVVLQEHDVKTEQPATFWLERAEEVHVRFELPFTVVNSFSESQYMYYMKVSFKLCPDDRIKQSIANLWSYRVLVQAISF